MPLGPALREHQARILRERIRPLLDPDEELDLAVTSNRSVMVSVNRDPRHHRLHVRLHHMFVEAGDSLLASLVRYILHNEENAACELRQFIETHPDRTRHPPRPRPITPRPRGQAHDLRVILDELNRQYFDGRIACAITWGRQVARGRPRHSIHLGSYTVEDNLIRIHPGLDQAWVPGFYIRWIVFHEMLHLLHPVARTDGRRCFHSPGFRRDLRSFALHAEAEAWERQNLAALLCL